MVKYPMTSRMQVQSTSSSSPASRRTKISTITKPRAQPKRSPSQVGIRHVASHTDSFLITARGEEKRSGFFSPLSRIDVPVVLVIVAVIAVVVVLPVHNRAAVVLVIRLGGPNHPAWSILVADLSVVLTVIRHGRRASSHPTWSSYQSSDLAVIVIPPGRRSHPTLYSIAVW
ncbi:hypothetical protein K503DRAFT_856239 [Rhizopogon vinicolor AM-OR11-026]|uniref:Uncharacterized protein n=1 Tax=Rhizopogon vinicolor AM-OR11-026 TaxID=1314800 RepID=A0A1B7N2U6_9AGAM|nr:hypothetical protein K503DRAFT_856239 [Rhizopogon vinicolor AM-OR11-026]